MMLAVLLLLVDVAAGQFEEVASVPVHTSHSLICQGHDKPIITERPKEVYEVELGEPLKITCGASGIPMPYVYWIKGKADLTGKEERLRVTAAGQSVLFFEKVEFEDVDYYTCVVEDCCTGTIQTVDTEIRVPNHRRCTRRQPADYFWVVVWEFRNWTDSHQVCKDHNMEFAVPRGEFQNTRLQAVIQESLGKDPNGKKFAHHNMVWIGISDMAENWAFTDVNNNKPIAYTNWMPKQPDNWRKHHARGQDVVAMDRVSGRWDDSYSFFKRPFACWCPPRKLRAKGRGYYTGLVTGHSR